MTSEQQNKLEAIKAALKQHIEEAEKATPGPWVLDTGGGHQEGVLGKTDHVILPGMSWLNKDDGLFIAAARTMSPLACKMALVAIEYTEFQIAHGQGGAGFLEDVISIWEGGQP